ncbi:hypothetical protein SEA_EVANESCE_47 [Mycobacterium phage Evanesce]|uniref:Uncharacterized protein n=14 Tax=Caudoviricetes TaxID=2731619 RepID=A0A385D057_9CAUD|nr:hypothetical protein Giles_46 [Mycobacterium phage Giles]AHY84232.1 hypothetical protein PBI_HH92_47 [Mycobacterium phage HH92]AKQ07824.1 hypothetical protein SEA_KINBOTE_48 [Mycobacterium phage Kinbote]ALA06692.1 hypothetical protein SEA_OBUpride_48 [Mycobacterium phage OBUpride]ALF00268.1 hypothetical protein SEA_EVANESCE_47 [Mycobacterium phage Evanesce]ATN90422.1 hypothetical protein SEA_LILHAZELNUT_48 [Mycobacterium phage LilHazelnut]AXQ51479.1 hypothetical protein SEA_AMOCHICK_48 [My
MSNHETRAITVDGKDYIVSAPRVGEYFVNITRGGRDNDDTAVMVTYDYWTARDGREWGATRTARGDRRGVGAKIWAAAREAFGADHDALIAAYNARKATPVAAPVAPAAPVAEVAAPEAAADDAPAANTGTTTHGRNTPTMSDNLHATGVHYTGTHVLLYDRNGSYVAESRFVHNVNAAITRTDTGLNAADIEQVEAWLAEMGYRLDQKSWANMNTAGSFHGVEFIDRVAFDWERLNPGTYGGFYGDHRARVYRTREGMIGHNEVMWEVSVDGRHVTNEGTLIDAKVAADRYLRRIVPTVVPDPEEPANVDGPRASRV